ncbi:ROK family protein [Luteibacter sp. 9135]|uniref:ROK family protein n=1 Tax=Lysobacterales TaxID=135614 RepID=UPI00068E5506|nr:ROK family protein [Luteibacter sp. 9135]
MAPPDTRTRRIGQAFRRKNPLVTFTENERALLTLVRDLGPVARSVLARSMGLAMQSVVRIVESLTERGFLRIGDEAIRSSGPGQPSLPVTIVPDAAYAAGASVTAARTHLVILDLLGRPVAERHCRADGAHVDDVVQLLRGELTGMLGESGIPAERLFGLGVATTGYFVGEGRLNTPAAMEDWALRDVEETLSRHLSLPVWIENDGNAATVGEKLFGVGRRYDSFAYVYVAAGLGGGVVTQGTLFRGVHGNAGEFTGTLPLEQRECRPSLARLLRLVNDAGGNLNDIDELLASFDIEWPGVDEWLATSAPVMTAIASAIGGVLDPEAIVIGGRIPPVLARHLIERTTFYAAPLRDLERPFPILVCAEAPGDAAALGAASLPFSEHFFL